MTTVPLVDYLELGPEPMLTANECTACGARFFDRRSGCARCFGDDFRRVELGTDGIVRAFTIVSFAAEGIAVPFVAALIDVGGTSVKANLVNVEPNAEAVTLGMPVALTTYSLGLDDQGVEAIAFGFEPRSTEGQHHG